MDHSISKVVFAVALSAVALGQNACTDDSTTGGDSYAIRGVV